MSSRLQSKSPDATLDGFVMVPSQNNKAESCINFPISKPTKNDKMNRSFSQMNLSNSPKVAWENLSRFDRLKQNLLTIIPNSKIHFYGSYAYGIPAGDSDLNIYIELSKLFFTFLYFFCKKN